MLARRLSLLVQRAATVCSSSIELGLAVHAMGQLDCAPDQWHDMKVFSLKCLSSAAPEQPQREASLEPGQDAFQVDLWADTDYSTAGGLGGPEGSRLEQDTKGQYSDATVVTCFHCLSHANALDLDDIKTIERILLPRVRNLCPPHACAAFQAAGKVSGFISPALRHALEERGREVASLAIKSDLMSLLHGALALRVTDKGLYESLASALRPKMGSFSHDDTIQMLVLISKSGSAEVPRPVLLALADKLEANIKDLSALHASLAIMAFGKARLGQIPVIPLLAKVLDQEIQVHSNNGAPRRNRSPQQPPPMPSSTLPLHNLSMAAAGLAQLRRPDCFPTVHRLLQALAGSPDRCSVNTIVGALKAASVSNAGPQLAEKLLAKVDGFKRERSGEEEGEGLERNDVDEGKLSPRDLVELLRATGQVCQHTNNYDPFNQLSTKIQWETQIVQFLNSNSFTTIDLIMLLGTLAQLSIAGPQVRNNKYRRKDSNSRSLDTASIIEHVCAALKQRDLTSLSPSLKVNYVCTLARLRVLGLSEYNRVLRPLIGPVTRSSSPGPSENIVALNKPTNETAQLAPKDPPSTEFPYDLDSFSFNSAEMNWEPLSSSSLGAESSSAPASESLPLTGRQAVLLIDAMAKVNLRQATWLPKLTKPVLLSLTTSSKSPNGVHESLGWPDMALALKGLGHLVDRPIDAEQYLKPIFTEVASRFLNLGVEPQGEGKVKLIEQINCLHGVAGLAQPFPGREPFVQAILQNLRAQAESNRLGIQTPRQLAKLIHTLVSLFPAAPDASAVILRSLVKQLINFHGPIQLADLTELWPSLPYLDSLIPNEGTGQQLPDGQLQKELRRQLRGKVERQLTSIVESTSVANTFLFNQLAIASRLLFPVAMWEGLVPFLKVEDLLKSIDRVLAVGVILAALQTHNPGSAAGRSLLESTVEILEQDLCRSTPFKYGEAAIWVQTLEAIQPIVGKPSPASLEWQPLLRRLSSILSFRLKGCLASSSFSTAGRLSLAKVWNSREELLSQEAKYAIVAHGPPYRIPHSLMDHVFDFRQQQGDLQSSLKEIIW